MNRAGYAIAVAAKLFETAHKAQAEGKNIDQGSVRPGQGPLSGGLLPGESISAPKIPSGFHNPTEAGRICGDSVALADKVRCGLLRQALTKAGVDVPANVNLELAKYLNNRGVKKLEFQARGGI